MLQIALPPSAEASILFSCMGHFWQITSGTLGSCGSISGGKKKRDKEEADHPHHYHYHYLIKLC
jgi:hypothetical protein